MPAPGFLPSQRPRHPALLSPDPQCPRPVPTLPPDPAPAGQQQRQAECQEQPQAGARHGPGDGLVAQGTGLVARAAPTASRAVGGGVPSTPHLGAGKEKGRSVGEGAGPERRPLGGATRVGHPGVLPRPPSPEVRD